ncbi:hypothetical protein BU16DRAFT_378365 [Lophium mytilinum]|uniref:Uncharacterized protein n=1 Tax=Lophium mytilinum TaxID=390894 RepID=A0A6A6QZE2_9PEZI|nr:hypothetical protein BU16DRAFT_378365 [Lophium mytilinum]
MSLSSILSRFPPRMSASQAALARRQEKAITQGRSPTPPSEASSRTMSARSSASNRDVSRAPSVDSIYSSTPRADSPATNHLVPGSPSVHKANARSPSADTLYGSASEGFTPRQPSRESSMGAIINHASRYRGVHLQDNRGVEEYVHYGKEDEFTPTTYPASDVGFDDVFDAHYIRSTSEVSSTNDSIGSDESDGEYHDEDMYGLHHHLDNRVEGRRNWCEPHTDKCSTPSERGHSGHQTPPFDLHALDHHQTPPFDAHGLGLNGSQTPPPRSPEFVPYRRVMSSPYNGLNEDSPPLRSPEFVPYRRALSPRYNGLGDDGPSLRSPEFVPYKRVLPPHYNSLAEDRFETRPPGSPEFIPYRRVISRYNSLDSDGFETDHAYDASGEDDDRSMTGMDGEEVRETIEPYTVRAYPRGPHPQEHLLRTASPDYRHDSRVQWSPLDREDTHPGLTPRRNSPEIIDLRTPSPEPFARSQDLKRSHRELSSSTTSSAGVAIKRPCDRFAAFPNSPSPPLYVRSPISQPSTPPRGLKRSAPQDENGPSDRRDSPDHLTPEYRPNKRPRYSPVPPQAQQQRASLHSPFQTPQRKTHREWIDLTSPSPSPRRSIADSSMWSYSPRRALRPTPSPPREMTPRTRAQYPSHHSSEASSSSSPDWRGIRVPQPNASFLDRLGNELEEMRGELTGEIDFLYDQQGELVDHIGRIQYQARDMHQALSDLYQNTSTEVIPNLNAAGDKTRELEGELVDMRRAMDAMRGKMNTMRGEMYAMRGDLRELNAENEELNEEVRYYMERDLHTKRVVAQQVFGVQMEDDDEEL